MTDTYPNLRKPIQIAGCTIPNRILRAAHCTNMPIDGYVTDQLIAYHEARASGGVGLSFLEAGPVHKQSGLALAGWLGLYDEAFFPPIARLADRIRPTGMKLFQQLHHGGVNSPSTDGGPRWSSWTTPDPLSGSIPIAMTKTMIDEVVAAFATAARRCEEAGLDGAEVHGAHGYLCHQFLTPVYNKREDEYGGSLENRMRFLAEVLTACRESTSDDFAIGVRLSSTDGVTGGMAPEDHAEVAHRLERAGVVDFVNVSVSTYHDLPKVIGPMYERPGYELETSRVVTARVSVPTMVTGRIVSLGHAESVVADGISDMVSMVRATIADPDIVSKSFAGEEDRVRPCIGCNQGCIGFLNTGLPITCAVNPRAGRETIVAEAAAHRGSGRCVVVGGGIAGMEAARAAAMAGYKVTLFERDSTLGGQLAAAGLASARSDLKRITDWLAGEQARTGVEIRLGTEASAETVLAEEPDFVVVAAGSERRPDGFQRFRPGLEVSGLNHDQVLDSVAALSEVRPARHAVVFDDRWDAEAVSVAETLLDRGTAVTFATSASGLAPDLDSSLQRSRYFAHLTSDERFNLRLRQSVVAIGEDNVTLEGLDDGRADEVPSDLVVLVGRPLSRRDLAAVLAECGVAVELVGDALEATDLLHAIHSGHNAVIGQQPSRAAIGPDDA